MSEELDLLRQLMLERREAQGQLTGLEKAELEELRELEAELAEEEITVTEKQEGETSETD